MQASSNTQRFILFISGLGCVVTEKQKDTFTLDHPSNLTNRESHSASSIHVHWVNDSAVDSRLHIAMDKFAMFAVTCTHATLDGLIEILEKENEAARERAEEGAGYLRNLKVTVFLRAIQC
jgi:hypothetical protein